MRRSRSVVAAVLAAVAVSGATLFVASVSGGNDPFEKLGDDDPAVRDQAVERLVAQGPSVVLRLQTALVREPSPLVQAGIAEALRRVGMADSDVGALKDDLRSPSPATRRVVVGLVAATKPSLLAADLREIATDPQERTETRCAAARGLGRVGTSEAAFLSTVASDAAAPVALRAAALRALCATGDSGLATTASAAEGDDPVLRGAAFAAFADKDVPATSALVELLSAQSPATREAAASAMALRAEAADLAVAALKTALADTDARVRAAALSALVVSTKAHQATSEVVTLLSDPVAPLQAQAAHTLGHVIRDTSRSTLAALFQLLSSPDFGVRYEAAVALAEAGDGSGFPAMLNDSNSNDAVVARKATAALATIRAKTKAGGK